MPIDPKRVQAIFLAALEASSPTARATVLERECSGDAELRQRVEVLLQAHDESDSRLNRSGVEPWAVADDGLPAESGDRKHPGSPDSGSPLPAGDSVVQALGFPAQAQLAPEPTDSTVNYPDSATGSAGSVVVPTELPGRYRLAGEIARGGMGAVLKGRDTELGRAIAVKVLLETHQGRTELVQRFVEEARIAGQLQHPGIVPVYDMGVSTGQRPYFTMKLVKGQTLAALLAARQGPAEDLPRFVGIFEQVCQTLAYAHARRVIHRDLKPANVMVGAFGEVQVMDWGLAKVLAPGEVTGEQQGPESEREEQTRSVIQTARSGSAPPEGAGSGTQAGSVMGTPAYMAPEQARGEIELVDERADVFGLGAILSEVLTGQPPFTGKTAEAHRKAQTGQLTDALTRLDCCGADAELVAVARHCLAGEPWQRPRDAGEVASAVTAYRESVQARLRRAELEGAEARTRAAEERKRRRLTLALAASMLVTALLGGAAWLLRQHDRAARWLALQRKVDQALQDAFQAWEQAKVAPQELGRWEEALRAVELAEGLARDEEAEQALREQVGDLKARVWRGHEEARGDPRMLSRLEGIRLAKAQMKEGQFDTASADPAYAEAFRVYGIDVERLEPAEATARLRARAIRVELAVALDDWAWIRRTLGKPDDPAWRRLLALARQVDTDHWRNHLREALARGDRQALKDLAETANVTVQPVTVLGNLGSVLRELGDTEEAVALLRKTWRHYPSDFWINEDLALALGHLPSPPHEEALRHHTLAVAAHPGSAGAWFNLGSELTQQFLRAQEKGHAPGTRLRWIKEVDVLGELDGVLDTLRLSDVAIAALEKAATLQPDYADAWTTLGDALQHRWQGQGEFASFWDVLQAPRYQELFDKTLLDRSLTAYQKSIALRPNDAYPHFQCGVIFLQKDALDEALAQFREAVCLSPEFTEAHDNLVTALRSKYGDSGVLGEKTLAGCRKAVRESPANANAYFYLGVAYLMRAYGGHNTIQEAIDALRGALQHKPDPASRQYLARALCLQATKLVEQGKSEEAVAACREAIRLQPALAQAHLQLGILLVKRKQPEEGLAAFREAVRLPSSTRISRGGRPPLGEGVPEETLADSGILLALEEAERLNPGLGSRIAELKNVVTEDHQSWYVSACQYLVSHAPSNAEARLRCSNALLNSKAYDEALAEGRELVRMRPGDPAGYFQLGKVYRQMGRYQDSLLAYQRGHLLAREYEPSLAALRTFAGGVMPFGGHPLPAISALIAVCQSFAVESIPSARWVEEGRRLAQLEHKLAAVLAGQGRPASAEERIELARMCATKQLYRSACHFYTEAFAEHPELTSSQRTPHRYNAACAAALAGCGRGKDALLFECAERVGWRKQALEGLRRDLASWNKRMDTSPKPDRAAILGSLRHWQWDSDLAGVRGPQALAKLPADEREDWTCFWAEVEALVTKAQEKK